MTGKSKRKHGAIASLAGATIQTIENLTLAFVLAFVFRAFLAEAYRIPTGSMAPTLRGSHQFQTCRNCGYQYAYEVAVEQTDRGGRIRQPRITRCPNCSAEDPPAPLYANHTLLIDGGDRILVAKLGYELAGMFPQLRRRLGPRRWDVVVFKNPTDATVHPVFIKRLIGLPGETVEIVDGDVYIDGTIARKTTAAQRSLWFIVSDCDYLPTRPFTGWRPLDDNAKLMWDTSERVMVFRGHQTGEPATIAYYDAYDDAITDFYAYDDPAEQKRHVPDVSDLKVTFMLVVREGTGAIELALAKRRDVFIARITSDGTLKLFRTDRKHAAEPRGRQNYLQLASTTIQPLPVRTPVLISFQNVDYRVSLTVDGHRMLATTDRQYAPDQTKIRNTGPDDNAPFVRILAQGLDCQLWHLELWRDIYYRYVRDLDDPSLPGHGVQGNPIRLGNDEYYVLGDNSPKSKDSRLWRHVGDHLRDRLDAGLYHYGTVPADQLVGRAVFVYWPAGYRLFRTGPAIIPNVGAMRFVR